MICAVVIVCYGLAPFTGALVMRHRWFIFRKRFNELRLRPFLDYCGYCKEGNVSSPGIFQFTGDFESVTDGQTLWLRSDNLTVPVSLKNAESYLLSGQESGELPDGYDPNEAPPEKIQWEKVLALTEGARVFVGGPIKYTNGRPSFVSTKENPLIVIFYNGTDQSLANRVIRSSRNQDEYWNFITPYSLIIGALILILIALLYQSRPAYRLTVIVSVISLFIPLYPVIPPGLLFTVLCRRLFWRARALRACGDLVTKGDRSSGDVSFGDGSFGNETLLSNITKAALMETAAWVFLLGGIALNIFFVRMILVFL